MKCAHFTFSEKYSLHYKIFGQMQCRKSVAKDPKNGSNCTFDTIVFWLNVVALVRAARAECNGLRFICDTQPLYCNTFDAFATHGECCNTSNCNHYGCGNSINCNELGIASDTYCDTLVV